MTRRSRRQRRGGGRNHTAKYVDAPVTLLEGTTYWHDFTDKANLFQDSARLSPVTASGQSIGSSTNLGSDSAHIDQSSASNQPIWVENVSGTLGASRHNEANNEHLDLPLAREHVGTITMLNVIAYDTDGATAEYIAGIDVSLTHNIHTGDRARSASNLIFGHDSSVGAVWEDGVVQAGLIQLSTTGTHRSEWNFDSVVHTSETAYSGPTLNRRLTIGARTASGGFPYHGDIFETALWEDADPDLDAIKAYVANKYGITWLAG